MQKNKIFFRNLKFLRRISITIGVCTLFAATATAYGLSNKEKKIVNDQNTRVQNFLKMQANAKLEVVSLKKQMKQLDTNYQNEQQTDISKKIFELQSQIDLVNVSSSKFDSLTSSIDQAKNMGISIDSFNAQRQIIIQLIISQKYKEAVSAEESNITQINNAIILAKDKLAQQQVIPSAIQKSSAANTNTPTSVPTSLPGSSLTSSSIAGYGVKYISIDLNTPHLRIITDSANSSDCTNNCNVNDLMSFYTNNKGFAAINGTYFCPTAYPSCSRKTNTFDFPFYNSNVRNWLNYSNISWINRAGLTFSGTLPTFFPNSQTVPANGISAGFVMAPGLVQNGQIIVQNYPLDTKSTTAVTTREAIGIKGNALLIVAITGATVPQSAVVMEALGVSDAVELDGGGSTAMIYNGQYVLGPGRNIPNALIFSLQ